MKLFLTLGAAALVMLLSGPGCGDKNGVITEVNCRPPDSLDEVPKAGWLGVRLERPPKAVLEFKLYPSVREKLRWRTLDSLCGQFNKPRFTIIADVPVSQGEAKVKLKETYLYGLGGRMADIERTVKSALSSWEYTPYMSGRIKFQIDIGKRSVHVDFSELYPDTIKLGTQPLWDIPDAKAYGVKVTASRRPIQ